MALKQDTRPYSEPMSRNSTIWLIVGVLAAIALIIFIISRVNISG